MKTMTKLWIGLGVLAAFSPLGILFPSQGQEKLSDLWRAPMPDYSLRGWEEKGSGYSNFAYIVSALAGIAAVGLIVFLIGRLLVRPSTPAQRRSRLKLRSGRFIERSIMSALAFLKESVFAEEYAAKNGFLQAREPRVKIVATGLLLLSVLLTQRPVFAVGMYGFCLVLAMVSAIPSRYFLKRTWIFIPLFSLFIALPALFDVFSPGETFLTFKFFGVGLIITEQGLASAGIFFLRVLTSVSLAVLLSLTTPHAALLRALRSFGIPKVFVMTLGMCYRYIYLFIEILENTYTAIKSRVGGIRSSLHGQKIVAANIAGLWQRSYQLQEQVYGAMVSRGYNGEPHVLFESCPSAKDWVCLAVVSVFFAGGIWLR